MFGDISEAANNITAAFAQLNENLAKQIDLLQKIEAHLAKIESNQRGKVS